VTWRDEQATDFAHDRASEEVHIMRWVLGIAAILLFLAGLVAVASIKSDIQVIVAVLCFGFSFSILGLAAILEQLQRRQ
jgi:uncharacterized membrane protein HdeD (DUF308 family)